MWRIYSDDTLIWSPELEEEDYAVADLDASFEAGSAGSLEFTIPVYNPSYDSIKPMKSVIELRWTSDGVSEDVVWKGRATSKEKDYFNASKVACEGTITWLNDSVRRPTDVTFLPLPLAIVYQIAEHNLQVDEYKQFKCIATGYVTGSTQYNSYFTTPKGKLSSGITMNENASDLKTKGGSYALIVEGTTLRVEDNSSGSYTATVTINVTKNNGLYEVKSTDYESSYDYISGFQSDYGGYLWAGVDGYIYYKAEPGVDGDQLIQFGDPDEDGNLIDMTITVDMSEVKTVLIPLGKNNDSTEKPLTISSASGSGGNDYITAEDTIVEQYGKIWAYNQWENVSDASILMELGREWLAFNVAEATTYEINALDLALLGVNVGKLIVGNRYHIYSLAHDVDTWERLVSIEPGLDDLSDSKYTFGVEQPTFTGIQNGTYNSTKVSRGIVAGYSSATSDDTNIKEACEKDVVTMESISGLDNDINSESLRTIGVYTATSSTTSAMGSKSSAFPSGFAGFAVKLITYTHGSGIGQQLFRTDLSSDDLMIYYVRTWTSSGSYTTWSKYGDEENDDDYTG